MLEEGVLNGEETMRLRLSVLGVGFGEGREGQLGEGLQVEAARRVEFVCCGGGTEQLPWRGQVLENANWFVEALPAGGVAIAGQKFPFFFHQRLSFINIYYYCTAASLLSVCYFNYRAVRMSQDSKYGLRPKGTSEASDFGHSRHGNFGLSVTTL